MELKRVSENSPPCRPLIFGETLVDELPSGPRPGGAPLNVARHLQAFGARPLLVTRIGADSAGESLFAAMRRWRLDTSGVQTDSILPTGRAVVTLAAGSATFEIPAPAAFDAIDADSAARAASAGETRTIVYGTLAIREPTSRMALAAILESAPGAERVVDLNLRPPWDSRVLASLALDLGDVARLSTDELRAVSMVSRRAEDSESLARRLLKRRVLRSVIVTSGASGSFRIDADGGLTRVEGSPISGAFVDSVGAGDAFTAVCVLGLLRGWQQKVSMAFADAFARAICTVAGALPASEDFYEPFCRSFPRGSGDLNDEPMRLETIFGPNSKGPPV
ncbi:MAG: PfkB family carbohydrate kinase [Thermoanaerobaculia bacterium]